MNSIVFAILALSIIGAISALILYFVAQKFKVYEDPRIDKVCEKLPGANCGGCGFAGCRALAEAIVKEENLENKFCPVGGAKTMEDIAVVMNLTVEETEPKIAVVR
jgi:RnfABCDGE-type electron transport complex B subunit